MARTKNALRHGVYSDSFMLPWEDLDEFSKLHEELRAELDPEGPLQEDVVLNIAGLMWKKRRLATGALLEFGREPNAEAFLAAAKGGQDGVAKYVQERLGQHDRIRDNLREAAISYHELQSKLTKEVVKELAGEIERSRFEYFQALLSQISQIGAGVVVPMAKMMHEFDLDQERWERPYRSDLVERDVKLESFINKEIEKAMTRLVNFKEYKRIYGNEQGSQPQIEVTVSPPVAVDDGTNAKRA